MWCRMACQVFGLASEVTGAHLIDLRDMVTSMGGEQTEDRILGQIRIGAAQELGDFVRVRDDFRCCLLLVRLGVRETRRVVVANRAPVAREKIEQLVRGGLAVEGRDRGGERLRVGNHFLLGDLALHRIVGMSRHHVTADPEDVFDPQVAQGHLGFQHGDPVRRCVRCRRCGHTGLGEAENHQGEGRKTRKRN